MGKPSFVKVMQGINLLKKHNVEWNAMAVVNDFNADYPLDFYHFFKEIDCHYIQFGSYRRTYSSASRRTASRLSCRRQGRKIGRFLRHSGAMGQFPVYSFDEWVKEDVGNYYIQIFDSTLANWMGEQPGICTMAKTWRTRRCYGIQR